MKQQNQAWQSLIEIKELLWLHLSQFSPSGPAPIEMAPRKDIPVDAPAKEVAEPKKSAPKPVPPPMPQQRAAPSLSPPKIEPEPPQKPISTLLPLHEKKKWDKLFPRPYRPAGTQESDIKPRPEFPAPAIQQWKIVFLNHPNQSSPILPSPSNGELDPLAQFTEALYSAIKAKLQVEAELLLFSDVQKDPIATLSLADGLKTIFAGDEHRLSEIEQFLGNLPEYTKAGASSAAPFIGLGSYFETTLLFLPLNPAKVKETAFKQIVWHGIKLLKTGPCCTPEFRPA